VPTGDRACGRASRGVEPRHDFLVAVDQAPVDIGIVQIAANHAGVRRPIERKVVLGFLHPNLGVRKVLEVAGVIQVRMTKRLPPPRVDTMRGMIS